MSSKARDILQLVTICFCIFSFVHFVYPFPGLFREKSKGRQKIGSVIPLKEMR